ncbi:MAG: ATP-binding protein [Oligoflexus sp.]
MTNELSQVNLEKKLNAANKTLKILKSKVIELYNQGAQSVIHKQLEKAKQRDEENRRKREMIEVRNQELQRYSETLEAKVAERTAEVKMILNHVRFGFMTVDRNLVINNEYTVSCHDLFQQSDLGGMNFLDLLELSSRSKEHYLLCVDQIFEDIMPEEVSIYQTPQRFVLGQRVLKIEPTVIRENDKIARLLYSISDITQLEAAQKEAATHRFLVGVLRQLEAFHEFIGEVREQIRQARLLCQTGEQEILRRILHTLKGNSASWSILDIPQRIHEIEEEKIILSHHLDEIDNSFRHLLTEHKKILGIDYDQNVEPNFEVSPDHIHHLKSIVDNLKGREAEKLRSWTAKVLQKPVSSLLGPVEDFMQKLSQRLCKDVDFVFEGHDTSVDVETMRPILQNLIHALRNAVDHGIEDPAERGHKEKVGRVGLKVYQQDDNYLIEVSDDGRGIDIEKLSQKALRLNLVTVEELQKMSPKQKLELIFLDGLSSAEATTEISGRGVGMSAILQAVKSAYGTLDIVSEQGKGTTMKMSIPVPELLRSRFSEVA